MCRYRCMQFEIENFCLLRGYYTLFAARAWAGTGFICTHFIRPSGWEGPSVFVVEPLFDCFVDGERYGVKFQRECVLGRHGSWDT